MMTKTDLARAEAALADGDLPAAEKLLRDINSDVNRRSPQSELMLAHVLTCQNEFTQAESIYRNVLARTTEIKERLWLLNRLCDLFFSQKSAGPEKLALAVEVLEQSVHLEPGPANSISRLKLCILHSDLRNYESVVEQAWILVDNSKYVTDARLYLSDALFFQGHYQAGKRQIEEILNDSRPIDEHQAVNLLGLLVKYQLYSEAQKLMEETNFSEQNRFLVGKYKAQIFVEQREFDSALSIITDEFIASSPNEDVERYLHFCKGRSLDAIGNYPEAQRTFSRMNLLSRRSYSVKASINYVAEYQSVDLKNLPCVEAKSQISYSPVFMVGFPRSGTTLLDSILDTQRCITILSEADGIHAAILRMHQLGKAYPSQMDSLTDNEIEVIREAYFQHSANFFTGDGRNSLVVDKMPLNILHMPLILVLFPGAKFIVSLRHPVDVCISCFQQDFVLTDEMYYFTDLQTTFERYRDVMSLYIRYSDELNPDIHQIKYEDLIRDFEQSAGGVFDFLQVEGDDEFRDFYLKNREKALRTPSRDQVTRPIYSSSSERWKNYSEFVRPQIPLIRPFVDRFGYAI